MRRRIKTSCRFAVVFLGGIGLVSGCTPLPPQAVAQIEQARGALEARRYAECEWMLDPVIRSYSEHAGTALALYMRGQCRLMTDQRQKARHDFIAARRLARDRELRAWINVQLGNVTFDDGHYGQARMHYAEALADLPACSPTDRVLYQYGLALQRSRHFAEARPFFARVYREYPSSRFAAAARQKYLWDDDYFAVQCGAYQRIDLAHQAAARLRQRGVKALAFPELRNGRKSYVVRVGRFRSYQEASRLLAQVRGVQHDAFIVP